MTDAMRLDHLAFGVPDVAKVVPFVVGELGGVPRRAGPGGGYRFWQWSFAGGGVIEILEPDGPPGGFLHRFLDARGPGPHHVTFKLSDLAAALRRAAELGFDVVGVDDSDPRWKEAFLHPKSAQGIVVQLAQSSYEPPPEPSDAWGMPASPADPPPPVTLLGLRMNAASADRAGALWGELLGADCERDGGALVFRWRDSPMRVVVITDPTRPEGPVAVEIASDRPVRLPEGAHPLLGAPFALVEKGR